MKLLLDTNVLLDVFLRRHPYAVPARQLFTAVERGACAGLVCATSVTTVFYVAEKALARSRATRLISRLLEIFEAAPVTGGILTCALQLGFEDYEDAVIYQAAQTAGADAIVTRDARGFRSGALPIYEPAEALALISGGATL